MLQVHPLLFTTLLEVLGVCVLVLLAWPLLAWRRRRRARGTARALVAAVKEATPTRRIHLGDVVAELGLAGEAGETRVEAIERAEKAFYKSLLDHVLGRGTVSPADFVALVGGLGEPYLALCRAVEPAPSTVEAADGADPEALAALQEERDKLEEELGVTRNTLQSIMNEYAQMFERGANSGADGETRSILDGEDEAPATATPGDDEPVAEAARAPTPEPAEFDLDAEPDAPPATPTHAASPA